MKGAGARDFTKMSMERLFSLGSTPAEQIRQNLQDMSKLMEAVAIAKEAVQAHPPSAKDENLALKRLILDTDAACFHFQSLDAVSLSAVQQAKQFSLQLALVLEEHRNEVREYVAGLIALLCRTIHNQEVFSDLLHKAHRDTSVAQRRVSALEKEAQLADERVLDAHRQATERISVLEKQVEDQQEEATRLELEASRPLWQWKDAAADPNSSVPSQAWYEAEMAYLQNKNSELTVANRTLKGQKQDDLDRASDAHRRIHELELETKLLTAKVSELTVHKTFADAETQTETDMILKVHTITPNLIARGGSGPAPPYKFKFTYRNFRMGFTYDLELPEHFKFVYEDYQDHHHVHDTTTGKKHHKKKGRMEIRGKSNPVRAIINNVSDHTSIELALRTTTRWIDEIWASRIVSSHNEDPSFQNLSMDPLADCSDDFCKFVWNHFVTKYGTAQEAGIHTGDFITSLRKHRDTSHRVRIFSEFVGVDLRRSKKSLSLHIIIIHQIMILLRPDSDNGVVWCPLEGAERAAHILTKKQGNLDASAISTFFSDTLPGIATIDPNSPKDKQLHVVDCDLFAEALLQLLMTDDNYHLEQVIDRMCDRADRETLISLPRFMSLMGVLNATLDDEMLLTEFERLVANNDVQALSYEEFLAFARQYPLHGTPEETQTLQQKEAPTFEMLKAAIDRFWYTQARRMRQTLEDLQKKEKRMKVVFEKFDYSLRYLDRELGHGRIEILTELWVYARIMMGEALAIRQEEHIPRITKPRPSFFRAKTRKLQIMKALLPRSAKY